MTDLTYSRDLAEYFFRNTAIKERIEHVVRFFPELERVRFGKASRSSYYDPRSGTIRVTGKASMYVIGHEITHLMQDGKFSGQEVAYPKGERSCDLYLFARSPDLVMDVWEVYDTSYMGGKIRTVDLRLFYDKPSGQRMIHEVCAGAIRLKGEGKRDYIRWAEKEINRRIKEKSGNIKTTQSPVSG